MVKGVKQSSAPEVADLCVALQNHNTEKTIFAEASEVHLIKSTVYGFLNNNQVTFDHRVSSAEYTKEDQNLVINSDVIVVSESQLNLYHMLKSKFDGLALLVSDPRI
jgi:hypothetical protein